MRILISKSVQKNHPLLERELWESACIAKDIDPDIILMGLLVKIKQTPNSDNRYWSGMAYPSEESSLYGQMLSHPAGRINLYLGTKVSSKEKTILMAHELRHIGHFHRGRKMTGYLNDNHMTTKEAEDDCQCFELEVLDKLSRARAREANFVFK